MGMVQVNNPLVIATAADWRCEKVELDFVSELGR